jgi:hypothetical protein
MVPGSISREKIEGQVLQSNISRGQTAWSGIFSIALFEDLPDNPPCAAVQSFLAVLPRRSSQPFNIEHSALPLPPPHSDRLGRSQKSRMALFTRRRILQRRRARSFGDATMQRLTA